MNTSFRKEVFGLCNILQNKDDAKKIGSLIHDMSVSIEDKESGKIKNNLHGDFAYIAKHSNNQFHGFLFVDDNSNELKAPIPLKVEKLSVDERRLIERGYKTIDRFLDLCLRDIKSKSVIVGKAINPYFAYREVKCDSAAISILTDEEFQPAVAAFKNGKVYKVLTESGYSIIFQKIDIPTMRNLMATIEKEMQKSYSEEVPADIRDFSFKMLDQQYENGTDILIALSTLIYALKESLRMACQLIYESICGLQMIVLNNDNIINIEKQTSNVVCNIYKVLIQGISMNYAGSSTGSVLLTDCDPSDDRHIHEFGMITAMTCSFSSDMGQTTKYSFVTVDEELISIHNLTDNIVKRGIPPIKITK